MNFLIEEDILKKYELKQIPELHDEALFNSIHQGLNIRTDSKASIKHLEESLKLTQVKKEEFKSIHL